MSMVMAIADTREIRRYFLIGVVRQPRRLTTCLDPRRFAAPVFPGCGWATPRYDDGDG